MLKLLKMDRSIYLIDDEDKSYRFYKRNPDWRKLTSRQNYFNKKFLNGYTRIFVRDTLKEYIFKGGGTL